MSWSSYSWPTSREELERSGWRALEWSKEHPIKFSAYASFILMSLFPIFVFLLFMICSIIGTLLFLVLMLLIGLIILAGVCSIVLCCSGCVAATITVVYTIASAVSGIIKWILAMLLNRPVSEGDSLKES